MFKQTLKEMIEVIEHIICFIMGYNIYLYQAKQLANKAKKQHIKSQIAFKIAHKNANELVKIMGIDFTTFTTNDPKLMGRIKSIARNALAYNELGNQYRNNAYALIEKAEQLVERFKQ